MLVSAGFFHVLPGPTLRIQSKQMGMPGWFIVCAGVLMICSGILHHFKPFEGLFAVCLCMGGTAATAAQLPGVHSLGGLFFTNATLAAALWVAFASLTPPIAAGCVVAFFAGVAGRVVVPTHPRFVKFFGGAAKKEDVKSPTTTGSIPKKVGEKKIGDSKKGSTKRRTESPALRTRS